MINLHSFSHFILHMSFSQNGITDDLQDTTCSNQGKSNGEMLLLKVKPQQTSTQFTPSQARLRRSETIWRLKQFEILALQHPIEKQIFFGVSEGGLIYDSSPWDHEFYCDTSSKVRWRSSWLVSWNFDIGLGIGEHPRSYKIYLPSWSNPQSSMNNIAGALCAIKIKVLRLLCNCCMGRFTACMKH